MGGGGGGYPSLDKVVVWMKTWTFCSSRQDTVTRLYECWRYHQEGFLSGVNGSLASWLRHISVCNTKLAVKLCKFLVKFDRIVSNET